MSTAPVMIAPYTIVLGNNDITNCEAALVIEGEEVFRVREDEGRLLVDCDVFDPEDRRVAKVVRNTVVYAAPGFRAHVKLRVRVDTVARNDCDVELEGRRCRWIEESAEPVFQQRDQQRVGRVQRDRDAADFNNDAGGGPHAPGRL